MEQNTGDFSINSQREIRTNQWERCILREREYIWWDEDTRRSITPIEEAFKAYQKDKSEEQHCAYKEANKAAKRAVAMAKE